MKPFSRIVRPRAVPLLVFVLLGGVLAGSGVLESLEEGAYALGMNLSAPRRASERFAVVMVNVQEAREAGEWPWPGPRLAELITRIGSAEPAAIAWMLPTERPATPAIVAALDRVASHLPAEQDARAAMQALRERVDPQTSLARAFKDSGRVLLGVMPGSGGEEAARLLMPAQLRHVSGTSADIFIPDSFSGPRFPPLDWARSWFPPPQPPEFQPAPVAPALPEVALATGVIPPLDATGRQALVMDVNGVYLPSLPLLMAVHAHGGNSEDVLVVPGEGIALKEHWFATSSRLEALPYFYPAVGIGALRRFDAEAVLAGEDLGALRDRVVLIGADNGELVETPVDTVPLSLAVAQAAASLYAGDTYLRPWWAGIALALLWAGVAAWLLLAVPRLATRNALIGTGIFVLLLFIAELALLVSQSLWLPLVTPIVALLIGHAILNGHRWIDERRRQQAEAMSRTHLALGEALRAQGQLDRAFEAFSLCLPGELVERQLDDLGLDYERKRHYAKALRVYRHLKSIAPLYPDIDARIQRMQSLESQTLRGRRGGPIDTVALSDNGGSRPRIGRYEIERELGRGAMGVVYLGIDSRIGREVAIKALSLADEFDGVALEEVKARFFREAEAAGRLSHPNIVTVYDVGEEDDLAYIAMDYLRGEALSQHAREDALLPLERVLSIGVHVAEALHYAHEQGVVHRDVKPANMVLTMDEYEVKVTDFGVAHLMDASKTRTGTIMGSPSFMSPEHVSGRRVDGRSDLWSLGVSLYQLLTGHLPFTGEPLATLMYRIANEPPDNLRDWRPDIPANVNAVIAKALAKDPDARYQTGRGMAGALRQCLAKLGAAAGN